MVAAPFDLGKRHKIWAKLHCPPKFFGLVRLWSLVRSKFPLIFKNHLRQFLTLTPPVQTASTVQRLCFTLQLLDCYLCGIHTICNDSP